MKLLRSLLAGVWMLLPLSAGGEVAVQDGDLPALVTALGSSSFTEREAASGCLRRFLAERQEAGDEAGLKGALQPLRKARDASQDPEVVERTCDLLSPYLAGALLWSRSVAAPPKCMHSLRCFGRHLLVQGSGWIRLYDSKAEKILWERQDMSESIRGMEPVGTNLLVRGSGVRNKSEDCRILLLEGTSGKTLWEAKDFPGPLLSMRVLQDGVFVGGSVPKGDKSWGGWVARLDPTDGKTVWMRPDLSGAVCVLQSGSQGLVAGGSASSGKGWIGCLQPSDGKTVWEKGGLPHTANLIDVLPQGILAHSGGSGWVGLYDAETRAPIWERTDLPGDILNLEVLPEGVLMSGREWQVNGGSWMELCSVREGRTIWKRGTARMPRNLASMCLLPEGILIGGDSGMVMIDKRGGEAVWQRDAIWPLPCNPLRCIGVDGGVLAWGDDHVGLFDRKSGATRWEQNGLPGVTPGNGMPAVVRSVEVSLPWIFVGGDCWLACLRSKDADR